jgi:hypothetical protein
MKVAVLQSNYLPWRGYFDIIHDVDTFVFYDDVQYTVNDWRNRNRIKTANGPVWITVPVGNQNDRRICDVELRDESWPRKHWRTIEQAYARAPHFGPIADFLRGVYTTRWPSLSDLNQTLVKAIAGEFLGIRTQFRDSREFRPDGRKGDRLLNLLTEIGATEYVSGPAARHYLDLDAYRDAGINVVWKDYDSYPEYSQLHGPFVPNVSIVDLLANCGPASPFYIWEYRSKAAGA